MMATTSSIVCECCLSADARLEIDFEYVNRGAREIYSKMLLECFRLKVPPDSATGWICDRCVCRLRDACSFRRLVALSQKTLSERRATAGRTAGEGPVKNEKDGTTEVKVEAAESDCSYYDFESDLPEAEMDNNMLLIKNELPAEWSSDDDDILLHVVRSRSANETSSLQEKRKSTTKMKPTPVKESKLAKVELTQRNSKTKKTDKAPHLGTKAIEGVGNRSSISLNRKSTFVANSMAILACSNATPFNGKTSRGYRCFYCTRCFEDPASLRDHTKSVHVEEKLMEILSRFSPGNYMIYFDITNLECTLCMRQLNTLEDLRTHVATNHGRKTHVQPDERDIPFKLTLATSECVKCDQKFETFGSLERHMNIHYRHYICPECEVGFITKRRLHAHAMSHTRGTFPCKCGKTFPSQTKLKLHEDAVHKMRARFKCSQCNERFFDYYKRQAHLVTVHNATPLEYKCNVCDRVFIKRCGLNRHTKKYHLQELNFACDQCSYKCFTNHELKIHMIKHTGQRVHECQVCKKAYARKKTLKEHMRIHTDDRRFRCIICGQAFVQKCSLNGHFKTHHSNTATDNC